MVWHIGDCASPEADLELVKQAAKARIAERFLRIVPDRSEEHQWNYEHGYEKP